ncbi:MAG: cytochrome D1 domain-containing protein, partial [bacterium]|nr:cytochrome D1 domain-containing protein [bacterium]
MSIRDEVGARKRSPITPRFLLTSAVALLLAFPGRGETADNTISGAGSHPGASRLVRNGVIVEFSAAPVAAPGKEGKSLVAGGLADVRFRITGEADGKPLSGLRPGGWLDIGRIRQEKGGASPDCREKVSLYLKGIVGIRPLVDLNAYYLLVLNRDPSISVIDPLVGMTGKTSLYASIPLKKPGADWVKSADERRLYVTIPDAGQVAVIDAESFKAKGYVDVGGNPVRIALQPDGAYLFTGFDGKEGEAGGVAMIDTASETVVARIATGKGHHEIAFSPDDRYAYVTNRAGGTVSVIDIRQRKKIRDVAIGGIPISLGYSKLARALYVADGAGGIVSVVDGTSH